MSQSCKELQVGDTFDFNGITLEVVRCKHQKKLGCDCDKCFAYTSTRTEKQARQLCNSLGVAGGWCGKIERSDRLDVVFMPKNSNQ